MYARPTTRGHSVGSKKSALGHMVSHINELDKSIRKHISMRTVRLWDRSVEGSPTFCTPVFSTPKKNDVEVWRLIDDFRDPNERLQKWRVRYERLSHLAATGARRGDWAQKIVSASIILTASPSDDGVSRG